MGAACPGCGQHSGRSGTWVGTKALTLALLGFLCGSGHVAMCVSARGVLMCVASVDLASCTGNSLVA